MRRHVIISGTGRAGTTFLVELLTRLGLDTGYDPLTMAVLPAARSARTSPIDLFPIARAGLEMDIRDPAAPYIVKTPYLCDLVEDALAAGIEIEHAIIPVRRFEAAAASRAHVQELSTGSRDGLPNAAGGLWDVETAAAQADMLRLKFTRLIEGLVRYDVPITFVAYPRLARDPDYLFRKIGFLLTDHDPASFRSVFETVVRPEWVHRFTPDDE